MKTLHLTLKRKWFDMIEAGIKTEEYREDKLYWRRRLLIRGQQHDTMKEFDQVIFKNGYAKDAPTMSFKVKDMEYGPGNPEWGAPSGWCFIIKLGERIQ